MTLTRLLIIPALLAILVLAGCGGGSDERGNAAARDTDAPVITPFGVTGSDSPILEIRTKGKDPAVQFVPIVGPTTTLSVTVGIVDQSGFDTSKPPEVLLYSLVSTTGVFFPPFPMERYAIPGFGTPVTTSSNDTVTLTENGYWRMRTALPTNFAPSGLMTVAVRATDKNGNTKTQPVGTIFYNSGEEVSATIIPYVPPFTSTSSQL